MTQARQILSRLREKGELHSWEMTTEMYIQQYNARVYDARKIIGCQCKEGKSVICTAKEHIISDRDNHFIYKTDTAERKTSMSEPANNGYAKFQAMGQYLKAGAPKPTNPYESIPADELEALKAKAEAWLECNFDHPKYPEALTRYEQICDTIIHQSLVGEPEPVSTHTEQKLI